MPSIPGGLTLGPDASIGGDLNYKACCETSLPSGVVGGNVEFTELVREVEQKEREPKPALSPLAFVGRWFMRQVRRLVTLLLVGAVMMWLLPNWTREVSEVVQRRPLPSLGWGVVAIAAFVLAMLVILIATILLTVVFGVVTLGGLAGRIAVLGVLSMATAAFGFSLTWAYVTKILISMLLGRLIFKLFGSPASEHRWWPMLLGVLIFAILAAVPVLGWLVTLAAVFFGLGAIWIWCRDRLASQETRPPAVETGG